MVAETVRQEFVDKGCSLEWPPTTEVFDRWSYVADKTDTERRLNWLNGQVRSSVERLSAVVSEETILRALGVWYTEIKPRAPGTDRL
jgi:hypothetical protein